MNKKQALKKLEKLKRNLTNCRFELIQNTLAGFGFQELQSKKGSSHFKFKKDNHVLIVPFRRPVREIYVKEVIKKLEVIINEEYEE